MPVQAAIEWWPWCWDSPITTTYVICIPSCVCDVCVYEYASTNDTIGLHKDFVEQRLFSIKEVLKTNELMEEKEILIKDLQNAKTIIDRTKQWSSDRLDEDRVREGGKKDQDDVVSYVRPRLRLMEAADMTLPKRPEDDNDWSSPSVGEVTPNSSNGSVRFTNQSWDAYMAREYGSRTWQAHLKTTNEGPREF